MLQSTYYYGHTGFHKTEVADLQNLDLKFVIKGHNLYFWQRTMWKTQVLGKVKHISGRFNVITRASQHLRLAGTEGANSQKLAIPLVSDQRR